MNTFVNVHNESNTIKRENVFGPESNIDADDMANAAINAAGKKLKTHGRSLLC